MDEPKSLKILHLSDLHVGMFSQEYLWPNLKDAFFKDLDHLHRLAGAWDAVLFSGDFAQKGLDEEFEEALVRIKDIWDCFSRLGFQPELICVPGNHDIKRPDPKEPEVKVLKNWFEERDIWEGFFAEPYDRYRKTSVDALAGYTRFLRALADSGVPMAATKPGLLPGDQMARLQGEGFSVGIVTFNSTWLQLTEGDYEGKLAVDLRQAHSLNSDLPVWCKSNYFNVVVTHHPPNWLHHENVETWKREISPAGRFDLHLFGHMHEPFTESRSISGSATRHLVQAPSLFGMEYLGDGKTERIHGYSLLSFQRVANERSIVVWPRLLMRHQAGQDRFVPNNAFILEDDRYFAIKLGQRQVDDLPASQSALSPVLDAASDEQQERDILKPLRHHLARGAQAHENVRLAEQRQCLEALELERTAWLASEWGLGGDEFLAAVLSRMFTQLKIYRLDASEYVNKESFSEDFSRKLGCNFGQFCDELGREPALLILDDLPTGTDLAPGTVPVSEDVESLASVLCDACPSLLIVIRTLQKPPAHKRACVQLAPLDEADIKAYVQNHARGGGKLTSIDALSALYRLTDGYPSRLDARLKELAIVSIEELAGDEEAPAVIFGTQSDAPPMLRAAIQSLAEATDKSTKRIFALLQALIVFPQGAELDRLRRFNGVHPFHNVDAIELMDRGLISVSETPDMDGSDSSRTQKLLVVPRPIRDYLRSITSDQTIDSLNMKAATLMFGQGWMEGSKDWPSQLDYSSSRCPYSDIANASALLIRLYRLHRHDPESRENKAILMLAAAFASALTDGAHYTSAANFCRDFLALMDNYQLDERRAHLLRHYAYASRMLGEKARARDLLSEIKDFPFSKHFKQDVLLELAYLEEREHSERAREHASAIMKIDRRSIYAAHAQAMIADLELSGSTRISKLKELESLNRRKGRTGVADNIALTLAEETGDDNEAAAILSNVLSKPRKSTDFYNSARAILELVERKINALESLSDGEISQLISCYQFLLNERIPALFNRCHGALWHVFTKRRNWENLMTLFRYTSMIWRLRGEEYREEKLLGDLKGVLAAVPPVMVRQNRVSHYYLARVAYHEASKVLIGT
ncbi:metallophosphoesterase [Neorhizobium galegae]|uniref:metallophosphoesterase family protein n=1 Tax=Neorhizobium galegae TaxID=399 RepID=UPI002103109D|nr:metallophosphoesterase [Neorhizobium galegae]MCQ1775260.1 metallophosphoesterase [Neorhizobium galegae]MCQ1799915.1 metallophosphoesterase [Neorhizobium galegae]